MDIVDVKLDQQKVDKNFGVPEDYTSFLVLVNDGDPDDEPSLQIRVPNNPNHPRYQEVRKWYEAQKKKPFKFEFLDGNDTPAAEVE